MNDIVPVGNPRNLPVLVDNPKDELVQLIEIGPEKALRLPHRYTSKSKKVGRWATATEYAFTEQQKIKEVIIDELIPLHRKYKYSMDVATRQAISEKLAIFDKASSISNLITYIEKLRELKLIPERLVPKYEEREVRATIRYKYIVTTKGVEVVIGKRSRKVEMYEGERYKVKTKTQRLTMKFKLLLLSKALSEVIRRRWMEAQKPPMEEAFIVQLVELSLAKPGTMDYDAYIDQWTKRLLKLDEAELMANFERR